MKISCKIFSFWMGRKLNNFFVFFTENPQFLAETLKDFENQFEN